MITGLSAYLRSHRLAVKTDLTGSVIGVAAEYLVGDVAAKVMEVARTVGFRLVVVFDGPGRLTSSPLDGLAARRLRDYLDEKKVHVVVAPSLAAAQLIYLYEQGFVSHVAGTDEVLLFGDAPLVIDLEQEVAHVLQRSSLLAMLGLPEPKLVEVALAAGTSSLLPETFAMLDNYMNPIESAAQIFQLSGSLLRAAASFDPNYFERFQRALCAVAFQPILSADGAVQLTNKIGLPLPRDLHEVLGRRLPDLCYWYLQKGLMGTELLAAAQWGWLDDDPHFSVANAPAYAELQRLLLPLRQQSLALTVQPLHRYFSVKDIESHIPGIPTLHRVAPQLPSTAETDPAAIASLLVANASAVLGEDKATPDLPKKLASQVGGDQRLTDDAQLALREYVEAALYSLMENGHTSRDLDTRAFLDAIPW